MTDHKVSFLVALTCTAGIVGGLQVVVPSALTLFELELLNVTCNATDYSGDGSSLSFQWKRIPPGYLLPPGPSLVIPSITTDDGGQYECRVTTTAPGDSQTAAGTVNVTILYSARWLPMTVNKFAGSLGQTGVLHCPVHSFPVPVFYWVNPQGVNLTSSSSDFSILSSGWTSTLTIRSVQQTDYGNYVCAAYNVAGLSRFLLPFQLPGKPDGPMECSEVNVGSSTATLNCIPGYDGGVGQGQLSFSVTKEAPGSSSATKTGSSFHFPSDREVLIDVNDLTPGVNYTLKVYAVNQYGQSDDSFGVLVWTEAGGSSQRGLPWAIIIGASVGGGVFIILLLLLLICCCLKCCARKRNHQQSTNHRQQMKSSQADNHVVHEESSLPTARAFHQGNLSQGRGGESPVQSTDSSSILTRRPQQQQQQPLTSFQWRSPVLNLNHNPGESYVGFQNKAYAPEDIHGGCERITEAERSLAAKHQLPLAGHGVLTSLLETSSLEKPRSSRIVSKQCSIPVPPFQPEVTWEYPREKLQLQRKLGEGLYGVMWQAKADGILRQSGQKMVAVKMLKDRYTPAEEYFLNKDLEVKKLLQPHPNLILLLGCCSQSKPLYVILELAINGSLLKLLRRQRQAFSPNNLDEEQPTATRQRHVNLTLQDLTTFALQVASGMNFLSTNQLIHRDLAGRSILLDDHSVCKLSDFGTVDDVVEMRQYESRTKRRLPLRWMAPESLTISQYSVQTDVWSFGVFVWEVMTLGSTPYPGLSGPQVMEFVQKGSHMTQPGRCPQALFSLMKDCWRFFPTKRPSFSDLKQRLISITEDLSNNSIYVDQMTENVHDILRNQPGEKC